MLLVGRFAWHRTRARAGLVALLTAMAALVVLALSGTLAYLDVSSTAGVRDAVASSPAAARTASVQTRLADDPEAQQQGAADLFDRILPPGAQTWSVTQTPPLPITDAQERAILVVDPAVADHATLTAGQWPADIGEVAVQADAASALDLAVGDVLEVTAEDTTAELTIVGTWVPDDPEATHWAGEEIVRTGVDPFTAGAYGPWLVQPETLEPLDLAPFVRWTITPGDLEPDQIDRWLTVIERLADLVDDDGLTVRGVVTSGSLATTLADIRDGLASVRASSAIPLIIVALVSLVAMWQLTRLLAALRERETEVLLSRGAARAQLLRLGTGETVVVALGALVGGGVVLAVFAGRSGFVPLTGVVVAVVTALVSAVIMLATSWRAAVVSDPRGSASGRARQAMTGGAVLLVGGLAGFSLWRFVDNGSPLLPGSTRIDLLAVGAPALALLALALLAVALAAPLSRGLAALAARRPGFSPVMELRQSSRHIRVNAVPVVLVALAAAIATIASGYAGTWQALRTASAQVSLGADVRVQTTTGVATAVPRGVADLAAAAGSDAVTGALQSPLRLDESIGQLTAFPMADAAVSSAPDSLLDPVLPLLTPAADPLPGIDLPADVGELTVDISAAATGDVDDGPTRRAEVRVWLAQGAELVAVGAGGLTAQAADATTLVWPDGGGPPELVTITNPDKGDRVQATLTATVPPGTWRVVAIDTLFDPTAEPTAWEVTVESLTAAGTDVLADTGAWAADTLPMPDRGEIEDTGPFSFATEFVGERSGPIGTLIGPTVQRFMPASDAELMIPVVTTPGWGGLIRPEGTDVGLGASSATLAQVGTIPVVPGNPDPAAALADLPTLQNVLLRTVPEVLAISQLWLSADGDPAQVADQVRSALGPRAEVEAAGEGVTDAVAAPARTIYWIAAVCALLLALPAIVAVATSQAAARRGEVVVLRAVGASPTQQGRSRTRELLGLELGAAVAGVGAGWLISALVMVPLIRSTAPQVSGAVPLDLTLAWVPGLALLAAVLVAMTVVALWYGARVRRQARDTTWREEVR